MDTEIDFRFDGRAGIVLDVDVDALSLVVLLAQLFDASRPLDMKGGLLVERLQEAVNRLVGQ